MLRTICTRAMKSTITSEVAHRSRRAVTIRAKGIPVMLLIAKGRTVAISRWVALMRRRVAHARMAVGSANKATGSWMLRGLQSEEELLQVFRVESCRLVAAILLPTDLSDVLHSKAELTSSPLFCPPPLPFFFLPPPPPSPPSFFSPSSP